MEVVGELLFLSWVSRTDIGSSVNLVSRYVTNSGKAHVNVVKQIVRYLSCTKFMSNERWDQSLVQLEDKIILPSQQRSLKLWLSMMKQRKYYE